MTARLYLTLVNVHLTGLPSEPGVLAVAAEHVDAVRALSVANVELAVSALVAGGAGAAVVVDLVQAGGAIEAGGPLTLVNVRLTPRA